MFHDTAGAFLAALCVLAPLALAAALLAIPADEARAHSSSTAMFHAETYPLQEAAEAGDLDSVNHFLAVHRVDVNAKDDENYTPLIEAAYWGRVVVVSTLIAAGADVNAKTNYGYTPLSEAVRQGHIAVVSMLIAAGADVNAPRGGRGNTPLHDAANEGHVSIVSVLIAAGADVSATEYSYGQTPLHYAAKRSRLDIVNYLLKAGADVNAKEIAPLNYSDHSRTPLHLAASVWGDAYAPCNAAIVLTLIAAGADLNPESARGTPLFHALYPGVDCPDVAVALIEAGADTSRDATGAGIFSNYSPLALLAMHDYRKSYYSESARALRGRENALTAAHALIQRGDDVNDGRGHDSTPLSLAWSRRGHGWYGLIDLLIEAGGHRGEACVNGFVVNLAAASPPCICPADMITNGACGIVAVCDSPSVRNASTNGCDCPAPNVGADGADAPGDCATPSVESCRGLIPEKFYDAFAGKCIPLSDYCGRTSPQFYSSTLSACAPYDECLAAGDCALSVDACARGFSPDKFYDAAAGECVSFAECHDTANLNRNTNECECTASSSHRFMRPDGSCESSCARAETGAWNGADYQCKCTADTATNVNGACELLYPCHDSAVRQADNSGCECPTGTFAHGDPSGGYHRSRSSDRYGERPIIPDSAICHAGHAPIPHNPSGWESAVYANNPTLVAHFISGHGRDPDENHALHLAAEGGYYLAAKTLIESGADINLKRYYGSGYGDSPLHFAVRNRRAKLITLLLRRGADADAQSDDDGGTALHLAAQRPDAAENAGLIAFLLDAGADPNVRNDDGWRPLDLAYHGGTPSDLTWQARRGMMAALIAGGATWSDECTSGAIPNENYRPSSGIADCVCPLHISERDSRGRCECPAHSHSQVNGRCLPKDSAQVEAEIVKMEAELLRLRASLVSLNARISAAAEMPREAVEEIAERAADAAQEIKRRRDNFLALARADLAGAPPPPVAMSDTAAECRMLGGEVQIHSATGIRVCSGIDANDTFCLVDSGDAYPCRGFFRHVRRCNDDYNRRALNPFFCGARCGERAARGDECE